MGPRPGVHPAKTTNGAPLPAAPTIDRVTSVLEHKGIEFIEYGVRLTKKPRADDRGKQMTKKRSHRARWVEGLDWVRVENILDPDLGGSPELYTALLKTMLEYLPDADPDLGDVIHDEAMRRAKAGEMSEEQAACYAEALQFVIEEKKRDIDQIKKIVARRNLRVVK